MKIFFISYWGVKDGLSVSTVYPNLKILSNMDKIESIYYFTVERDDNQQFKDDFPSIAKVIHVPIFTNNIIHPLITKIINWQKISNTIYNMAKSLQPDLSICRSAMAGAFGTVLLKKMDIPYIVESFEPHSDYMLESEVWGKRDFRYLFQKNKEKEIKKFSSHIITVSHNYYNQLLKDGVQEHRLSIVPCTVDINKFSFNKHFREKIREKIGIKQKIKVGIYLGKFGSIYYDKEAFELFKKSEEFFQDNFFLIILTPEKREKIQKKLNNVNFPIEKVWIGVVKHAEVPCYLSAADFAFSTIKPANSRKFCSPIKNGEYWANGLPVLIPDCIGDDSEIIKKEGGGAIFDINNDSSINQALENIDSIITKENYRARISELALKHRNPILGNQVYSKIICNQKNESINNNSQL